MGDALSNHFSSRLSEHSPRYRNVLSISKSMELTLRPVRHRSVYYNCRVIVYNKYIHLIRPKMWRANDGNYRERRYFQCWRKPKYVEEHDIPMAVWGLLESAQVQPLFSQLLVCLSIFTSRERVRSAMLSLRHGTPF